MNITSTTAIGIRVRVQPSAQRAFSPPTAFQRLAELLYRTAKRFDQMLARTYGQAGRMSIHR